MDDNLSTSHPQNILLEWQDYEYTPTEKTSDWFWTVGLVGFTAVIIAFVFKNFLFAIVLLISTFTVMLFGAREPEIIRFEVTRRGLKAKNNLYPFDSLQSFALKDHEEPHKLMIESNRLFLPHIIIPLGDANPAQVRNILSQFLPEVPFEESLIDEWAERLGF